MQIFSAHGTTDRRFMKIQLFRQIHQPHWTHIFRAKVVDVAANSLMIELTGNQNKLDAFLNLMADFEVLEMVRTGITGLGRGVSTLN